MSRTAIPNGQPFQVNRLEDFGRPGNRELAAVGRRMDQLVGKDADQQPLDGFHIGAEDLRNEAEKPEVP